MPDDHERLLRPGRPRESLRTARRSVFLIGTSHEYQLPATRGSAQFRECLAAAANQKGVKAIAEEMSLYALSLYGRRLSTCQEVADALGIAHRYCDPSKSERKDHGMLIHDEPDEPDDGYVVVVSARNPKDCEPRANAEQRARSRSRRRQWWLDQLVTLNVWPVLFVCGRDHTEEFRNLLTTSGIVADVLYQNWILPGASEGHDR